MGKSSDVTGMQFGELTAIKLNGRKNGKAMWSCLCSCGEYKIVELSKLITGVTRSCGHLRRERWGVITSHGRERSIRTNKAKALLNKLQALGIR